LGASQDIEVVGEAASGREALDQLESSLPDIVLVDAQMPDMSGVETTRKIKERWPQVKVLFLTVHSSYIEAAFAAGADYQLMKDCTRQELLAAVKKISAQKSGKSP
jgi:DNA-binding NarL/FixJ family response regulator